VEVEAKGAEVDGVVGATVVGATVVGASVAVVGATVDGATVVGGLSVGPSVGSQRVQNVPGFNSDSVASSQSRVV